MMIISRNTLLIVAGFFLFLSGCGDDNNEGQIVMTDNVNLLTERNISSLVLNQTMKYNIILPNDYYLNTDCVYPVLYLLHGMDGNHNSWAEDGDVRQIVQNAIKNDVVDPMIVVMPDAFNTFYVDGYQEGLKYETYFWNEFLPYIEETYRVNASREMRFIAGLSMGGFGASYYAFTHPDKFMYCYSMSGAIQGIGLTITPSISSIIAVCSSFEELPNYTIDCGTSDFLVYQSNQTVHEALESLEFDHEYIARDGTHDWVFWRKSLEMALERIGQYIN
jgi:S-formylglutathione hydrolase FrmB